jgi:hypothetical protein
MLANLAQHQPSAAELGAQLQACLSSRNICSVVHGARRQELVAGDITADLPAQDTDGHHTSFVIFLVRSIPRVRNDANQYCLISEKSRGAASGEQWDVYGWVLAPNGGETLPLEREVLDERLGSPKSLRGLAAAVWFFAARMSGKTPP